MSKKRQRPVFPAFKPPVATEEEVQRAMQEGEMAIGFDRARDGTETTVEGYFDPETGALIITDCWSTSD